jgi:hypothetical protein
MLMQTWRSGPRAAGSMRSYRASMSRSLARRGCANAMRMQRGWRRGRLGKEATGSHPDDEAAIAGSGSAIFDFRPGLKAIAQSCFCCTLDETRGFRLHGPSRLGMPDGLGGNAVYHFLRGAARIHHVVTYCMARNHECALCMWP